MKIMMLQITPPINAGPCGAMEEVVTTWCGNNQRGGGHGCTEAGSAGGGALRPRLPGSEIRRKEGKH